MIATKKELENDKSEILIVIKSQKVGDITESKKVIVILKNERPKSQKFAKKRQQDIKKHPRKNKSVIEILENTTDILKMSEKLKNSL